MTFAGFPKETFAFLDGIAKNNDKTWFEAHRDLYEAGYVAPARAFVEELGPKLRKFAPAVQFDAKINGSISRINRDIRFSKDKRPYKEHLSCWFWTGDRKGWDCPGFWFEINAKEAFVGVGQYMFDKEHLDTYRNSVIHPRSGKALLAAVAKVTKGGATLGGKTRKLMPRGFETTPDRAEYLLYEGLYSSQTLPAKAALRADFADVCAKAYATAWPIGQWLLEEVSE